MSNLEIIWLSGRAAPTHVDRPPPGGEVGVLVALDVKLRMTGKRHTQPHLFAVCGESTSLGAVENSVTFGVIHVGILTLSRRFAV